MRDGERKKDIVECKEKEMDRDRETREQNLKWCGRAVPQNSNTARIR